jgi:hypothetical protein
MWSKLRCCKTFRSPGSIALPHLHHGRTGFVYRPYRILSNSLRLTLLSSWCPRNRALVLWRSMWRSDSPCYYAAARLSHTKIQMQAIPRSKPGRRADLHPAQLFITGSSHTPAHYLLQCQTLFIILVRVVRQGKGCNFTPCIFKC